MNSTFLRTIGLLAVSALWLGSQPLARAQDANRDAALTISEARDIVDRLAKRTGEFRESFEKAVEHSMMNGTKIEDNAKRRSADLNEAAKKLKDVFNDKKDKNDPAVRQQVDKTLAAGADVNRVMTSMRFTEKLQRDWEIVRGDLNALAQIYGLSPL
jgi:hypothetical protein